MDFVTLPLKIWAKKSHLDGPWDSILAPSAGILPTLGLLRAPVGALGPLLEAIADIGGHPGRKGSRFWERLVARVRPLSVQNDGTGAFRA